MFDFASTEIGILAKSYIDQGRLIPDDIMTQLMLSELKNVVKYHVLLDGKSHTILGSRFLDPHGKPHLLPMTCWVWPVS